MRTITVAKKGIYKGYKYAIVEYNAMGHRCGYVEIPSGHPLFKKGYTDTIKIPKSFDVDKEKIGKRGVMALFCMRAKMDKKNISLDLLFDVHGGLTFSDFYKEFGKGWWLGFDCGHAGDAKDITIMTKECKKWFKDSPLCSDGIVRTGKYVETECKRLINQIIKYFDK